MRELSGSADAGVVDALVTALDGVLAYDSRQEFSRHAALVVGPRCAGVR